MNTSNCLHTLFEEQARLHPDNIAIKFESEEISYQDLDNQSSLLTNFLRSNGVETGDKVCIFLERSIKMMVGILGILKSGAAYVPIDPKTPLERINFLLNDFGSQALVTVNSLADKINCGQKIIRLDTDWELISNCSSAHHDIKISNRNIAVILYTSGSTGYPKGVLLSHKSLTNRLIWDRKNYKHSPDDIVLQHASYHFDFSILEMFMALASGGKLILARPDFHYESLYLIELIQKEKITKMGSVPSLLKAYINLPDFEKCTSLKKVFLGGEILNYELQNTFFEKSDAELINIYGPTETSISVLNWTCQRNSADKVIPIGFPVADMNIYLLDNKNKPVADGNMGEIYISGVGVADGYLNQPDLTAERFVSDPFLNDNKTRMYKTGDLGKRLADGSFQFMGRKDHQIKIRGLRIELDEIEHHILLHKSISGCVVNGVENKKGEMKLVAYVVPVSNIELNFENINNFLLSKLPDYMVPNLFVQMSEFLLSPNGKIDRKALPYPHDVRLLSQTPYSPPKNEIHRQLIRIWEKVLNLKPIGITDPYDRIGGDSLATVEIIRLMENEMGCKLPLASFANAKTIQDQAEIIALDEKPSQLVYHCREGKKTPVLFIRHVQGEITVSNSLMKHLCPDHPFLVALPFGQEPETVPDSIEEIAQIYVDSLEKQYPSQEYMLGGFSMGGLVALEIASILKSKGKSVKALFFIDTFHPEILNKKMNTYQIKKRFLFYLRGLFKDKAQNKKAIIKYLAGRWLNMIMSFFKKGEKHQIIRRLQELLGVHIDRNNLYAEDKNKDLALKFRPKSYNGDVILISAQGKTKTCIYEDLERNESIIKWGNLITGELYSHVVLENHNDIMKEPGVESIAQIINNHLSKD